MKKFKPGQLLRLKNRWKHAECYSSEHVDGAWSSRGASEPVVIGLKPFLMIEEEKEEDESDLSRVVVLYEERFYAFLQDAVVPWKQK